MMTIKWAQAYDDEWFQVYRKNQYFVCCDCGLVHKTKIKIKNNKIYMQGNRDNISTAAIRREMKKKS
jgi:hypothetical protein